MPTGTAALPSLNFAGSTGTGLSVPTTNTLSFDTAGVERMNIGATGTITVDAFTTAGVVHNLATGALASSLIVNADITPGTITNASLATIASTVATPLAIVVRDGTGSFNGATITATTGFVGPLTGNVTGNLTGTVTGHATLDLSLIHI